MTLVKIMLCMMPTSISAERSFSVLDRVKTKLRNKMGDERMTNLIIFSFYPEMVETIDLIALRNKFVSQTSYTNKRESLFGKFTSCDIENMSITSKLREIFCNLSEEHSCQLDYDHSDDVEVKKKASV